MLYLESSFFLTVRNPLVSSLEKLPHFIDVKRSQVNCLSEISVPSSCHTESYKYLLSTLLRFFFLIIEKCFQLFKELITLGCANAERENFSKMG